MNNANFDLGTICSWGQSKVQYISPDTLDKRKSYSGTGSKQMAILVYVRVLEEGCNKGVSVCKVL